MNPFNFSRVVNKKIPGWNDQPNTQFNIDQVLLRVGATFIEGLVIDKEMNSFKDHYFRVMALLNQANNRGGKVCNLDFDRYLENNLIILYDLTNTLNNCPEDLLPMTRTGDTRANIYFAVTSSVPCQCVALAEIPSNLKLKHDGRATVEAA